MALVKIYENVFENLKTEKEVAKGESIEQLIRTYGNGNSYNDSYVECYDCETGETFFAPIDDNDDSNTVLVKVNGSDKKLDYIIEENDMVEVFFLPASSDKWDWGGAIVGGLSGAVEGAYLGSYFSGYGTIIGAIAGLIIGFVAGGIITADNKDDSKKTSKGKDGDALPDVRGASNQIALNSPIPAVLGKCLATPRVVGSPNNDIYGFYGEQNYINVLYLVGYSPLKITDIKLGDQFLAHNQPWASNKLLDTIYSGKLEGTFSDGENDLGEIVNTWYDNDVSLEILQQNQNPLVSINWGTIYPYARLQEKVDADCLHIVDGSNSTVSYKNVSLKQGLRNNSIRFTKEYPASAKVELDFPQGLYKTWTKDGSTKYSKIPMWLALQWRVFSQDNDVIDGNMNGEIAGEMDSSSANYWVNSTKRGWHTFEAYTDPIEAAFYFNWRDTGSSFKILSVTNEGNKRVPSAITIRYDFSNFEIFGEVLSYQNSFPKDCSINFTIELITKIQIVWKDNKYEDDGSRGNSWVFEDEIANSIEVNLIAQEGHTSVSFSESKNAHYVEKTLDTPERKLRTHKFVQRAYKAYDIDHWWESDSQTTLRISKITIDNEKVSEQRNLRKGNPFHFNGLERNSGERYNYIDITECEHEWAFHEGTSFDGKIYRTEGIAGYTATYDLAARKSDLDEHTGNRFGNSFTSLFFGTSINEGWLGAKAFNLKELGADNEDSKGLSEFRVVHKIDFISWARNNLEYSTEAEFIQAFKDYFYPVENTTKSIEVRIVRISPNYIDEVNGTSSKSPATFNDYFKWVNLTTEILDEKKLFPKEPNVAPSVIRKRPVSDELMRKCCFIALRIKTDNTDQLSSTVKKLTCTAHSFAPYYDEKTKKWVPEDVLKITRYYKPNVVSQEGYITKGIEINRATYLADRQNGIKSIMVKAGNDFTKNLIDNEIMIGTNKKNNRYIIPSDSNLNKYFENNVASGILWAGLGAHAGINALSYEDYDLVSLAKLFEFCKDVKDGSFYKTAGFHYNRDGIEIRHEAGEEVSVYFTANGYIYDSKKLEELITALCTAGRCVWTRTKGNKLTFVIDKPEKYYTALINQANTISSSYSISYQEQPAGLQITFKDENDGFNDNVIYAMADGETENDYRGNIEPYSLQYVTSAYQIWSLGRYYLANRILNKEVVTKKIGMEGYSIGLGNLVCLQDDTMLIGTDFGGRITKLIEDEDYIYGFLTSTVYEYTGEMENGKVKKGVVVMLPEVFGKDRVLTLRMAELGRTVTIDGETYITKRSQTNVVILDVKIAKAEDNFEENTVHYPSLPKVDNVIGFGEVGLETALYRVIGIKQDNKHNFEFSLLRYQENLYNYGRELPEFNNAITKRDYNNDNYAISNSAVKEDVVNFVQSVITEVKGELNEEIASKVNTVIITLYKRSSSELGPNAGPTENAIYDFSPDAQGDRLVFENSGSNGWSTTIPEGTNSLYAIAASVVTNTSAGVIDKDDWSEPRKIGSDRDTAISVYLYQRSMTEPALPVANLSYNITTGVLTGDTNGWSASMNDIAVENFTQPLWITTAAAVGKETDVILPNEWSTPLKAIKGEAFSYSIESDISSVTKTLVPAVVKICVKPDGSFYELEINKCIAEQGDTISCQLERTMGGLVVIEGWWYTVEVMDGYWKEYLTGMASVLSPLTFSMPNKQIRIRAYKSVNKVEVVDEQIIYYKDSTKTIFYGNNMNMQIPVNTQLYPVNSGSKQVTLEGYIRERETRATAVATTEDLSDQTVLDRLGDGYFQIVDVSLPKDEEGNELVTYSIPNASTVQFNYTIENAIPKEYHGSIKVRYSYEKAVPGVNADGRETLNFVFTYDEAKIPFGLISVDNGNKNPSDEDRIEEVNAAYFKPNVPAITFNFTKSDDGAEYEEFEGSYKFSICRNNEWEEVVSGIGTSFTYEFDNNNEKAVDNPVSAYSIALYKDENCTEWVDSETIPVLFNDNEVRANLFNDNVTLVATSSGVIGSLTPTATGLEITKGTKKLKYSTTPITQMSEVDSVGFYNIALGETLNCTGASFDGTNPETLQISAISSLTQDAMYAYRVFNVSYMEIRQGTKIIGKTYPVKIGGRVIIPSKPIYEKIYEVKNLSIVQMIAVVKNGSKQKIEFAVGNFGLDTTNPTVMEALTWTSSMPTRNSTQCIYMRTDDSES